MTAASTKCRASLNNYIYARNSAYNNSDQWLNARCDFYKTVLVKKPFWPPRVKNIPIIGYQNDTLETHWTATKKKANIAINFCIISQHDYRRFIVDNDL